jgi:hypothetical protein
MSKKKTSPKKAALSRAPKKEKTPTRKKTRTQKSPARRSGAGEASRSPPSRKTTRYLDALLELQRPEREAFFERTSPRELLELCEHSYSTDLVNLLLDLKKSTVRRVFEAVAPLRKRVVAEIAALYLYKEYLTNPLPLRVVLETGHSLPNYYSILGVPRDATHEELKNAFRILERAHDPEGFPPALRKLGEQRLEEIRDAFNHLKMPKRRAKTDRLLPNVSYLYPRRDQCWLEALQKLLE